MDLKKHVCGDTDILISKYTNRPVLSTELKNKFPIFWCGVCKLKLIVPALTMQHMNGRSHRAKVNAQQLNTQNGGSQPKLKRGLDSIAIDLKSSNTQGNQEPSSKKVKGQTSVKAVVVQQPTAKKVKKVYAKDDPNLKCDDCDIVFDNIATAIPHFKGKKHVAKIAAKIEAAKQKASTNQKSAQRGGRKNRATWGYGVGSYQRRQPSVFGGGQAAAAGELFGALKQFYCNPLYSAHNNRDEYANAPQLNCDSNQSNVYFASKQEESYIEGLPKDSYNTDRVPRYYESRGGFRYGNDSYYKTKELN